MTTYESVTLQELEEKGKIPLEVVETEDDIYYHMALDMLERIEANNAQGKHTLFIVPVGPIGQYRRLAWFCNKRDISLKNVWFINMDEYLQEDGTAVPVSHPLSFEGFMQREFYGRMRQDLNIPPEQRIFPRPGREAEIGQLIEKLGGVDAAYGGIGINGHIAFNEPPEPGVHMTNEAFQNLPSRVLTLSRESRTINAVTAANGYIDYIPKTCVTVGMKEILSARSIRFYLNRQWQKGILRKIMLGEVTAAVPASFFQQHADAKLIAARYVTETPMGELR